MAGVGPLWIGLGVWLAPSVLLFVTIVLAETWSWFGRRIRALGRRRAPRPRGLDQFAGPSTAT